MNEYVAKRIRGAQEEILKKIGKTLPCTSNIEGESLYLLNVLKEPHTLRK